MMQLSVLKAPLSLLSLDGKAPSLKAYAVLLLLCGLFFLPGISTIPPVDRDEPRFAQATKQMIETNNYNDIRFQETPRYKKPIGIYWLQAASVKLFSPDKIDSIAAYRIPSFVGATASVCLTAAMGSLFFGARVGFIAALLMMSSLLLNVEARLAKTDSVLLALFMMGQYALAKIYVARDQTEKTGWGPALTFWIAQGLAFLVKGPLALLISLATILTVGIVQRRWKWLCALKPLAGIPLMLAIVLPWFIAITLASHGTFLADSAGHDLMAKIWQGQERGMVPPGLYCVALVLTFFPASLFVLQALPDIWQNRKNDVVLFCLGWIVPAWIIFEAAMTKLPHYVLPLYPALAILAAHFALQNFPALAQKKRLWMRPAIFSLWIVIGCSLVALPVLISYRSNDAFPLLFIFCGALLVAIQSLTPFLWHKKEKLALAMTAGMLALVVGAFGFLLPDLKTAWFSRNITQVMQTVPNCGLAADSYNEPSLVFLAGTKTLFINNGEELAKKVQETPCLLALVGDAHERDFLFLFNEKAPEKLASFEGHNLGSGRYVRLSLYQYAPF